MAVLTTSSYLKFPFAVDATGPRPSTRAEHVREQIEQILFTAPKERVFRPELGAGVRSLVFEPNNTSLWSITHKRLLTALAEALQGEVDPKTLKVDLEQDDARLVITVSYRLAAINREESQTFAMSGEAHG